MPSFDLEREDDEKVDGTNSIRTRVRAETGRMGEAQSLLALLSKNCKQEIDSLEEESYNYEKMRNRMRGLPKEHEPDDESLLGLLNEEQSAIDDGTGSLYDELDGETLIVDDDKKKDLERIQLQLETESTEDAIKRYLDTWKSARERNDFQTLPAIRKTVDTWYGALTDAIELEQWLYLNGDNSTSASPQAIGEDLALDDGLSGSNDDSPKNKSTKDRTSYGPLLCLLPAKKIAVLLAHAALAVAISDGSEGTKVVSLAMMIAGNLEMEVNVSRALRVRANERKKYLSSLNVDDDNNLDEESLFNDGKKGEESNVERWVYTASHLQRFMDELSDGTKNQVNIRPAKVRKRCREILLSEGFTYDGDERREVTMSDFEEWTPVEKVKLGAALIQLLLDYAMYYPSPNQIKTPAEPAFRYVRRRVGEKKYAGFVAIHPTIYHDAVEAEFSPSSSFVTPSTLSNSRVQPMVIKPRDWTGISNGGYETVKIDFMRSRHCKTQKSVLQRADLSKVFDGLNVLGRISWKINKTVLDAALRCWEEEIVVGDIPSQRDYKVPAAPEPLPFQNWDALSAHEKDDQIELLRKYKGSLLRHKRFKQRNMDLHSLRCSTVLKLNQAKKFRDFEEIFFPYNLDFRGRAYPVTPHLTNVGSDLCRALLMFAEPKPLGKNGLFWLKVHLANLAGADKMSFDDRAKFVEENFDNVRAAVDNPFGDNDWWQTLDDPFQGLATCHEIINAVDSGDHENYMCSMPVHMDGSCNGLQHYAALGLDKEGGKAVNLCVGDEPQDVYVGVMHEVVRRVAADAEIDLDFDECSRELSSEEKMLLKKIKSAKLVNGLIDRGVVKRTVMTSVYGVTFIGARNQIEEKINEKLSSRGYDIDEIAEDINVACGYLASLTMEVIGEKFKGARQTMTWLAECARLIGSQGQPVSFISPIGVPVVQPYRQKRPFQVITLLQNITLTNDSDKLPLHRQRQVSAFPPNYVHSLDSSHMLMTAIEMEKRGLHFSAVHDSFWTHPCDVEALNSVLRDTFIELYKEPLLEDLKQSWELRYPYITFPDLPQPGDLDLEEVRSAPYFFQ